jgi:hypothetical protein
VKPGDRLVLNPSSRIGPGQAVQIHSVQQGSKLASAPGALQR